MQTKYGLQVDAWGALVMERADLAPELEKQVMLGVREREVEGLGITKERVSLDSGRVSDAREHVIFQQMLGGAGRATVALRITARGARDLEISWRLFEKNVRTESSWASRQFSLILGGGFVILLGLITIAFGFGLCILPIGVAMVGAGLGWWAKGKRATTASSYEQFDSRALVQLVDYVLMRALSSKGVAAHELRVLHRADTSGLGVLTKTPVEDLTS